LVQIGVERSSALAQMSLDLLAVGLYEDEAISEGLGDAAAGVASSGDFSGREGETSLLYGQEDLGAPRLLLVGLGEREHFTLEKLRRTSATAAKRAWALKLGQAAFSLTVPDGSGVREAAKVAAEGAALGLYRFDRYKTGEENQELETFTLVSDDEDETTAGAEVGVKLAAGALLARDLANEPSNSATPEYLAAKAREIAERYGMEVTVFDRDEIET
jgi:leucyl aminopeptidase